MMNIERERYSHNFIIKNVSLKEREIERDRQTENLERERERDRERELLHGMNKYVQY